MSETLTVNTCEWNGLIHQAQQGCDEALGTIVSHLHGYMLSIANAEMQRGLTSKFSGSDIVQQSMLEAHQSIGSFRGKTEPELKTWLKKIVLSNLIDETRRYCVTQRRDTSREVTADWNESPLPQPNGRTASWIASRAEFDLQLYEAVQALPVRQRYVIEARHRDNKPYAKIALELSISEDAARKLWARGIRALKRTIETTEKAH